MTARRLNSGFTLIELLIVIALLGILAVVVLSAIDPLEQARKSRDAARKQDASELLNAYERYYSTFGCYSWDTACSGTKLSGTVNPAFTAGGNSEQLVSKNEIKTQFTTRSTVTKNQLWVTEASSGGLVSVCYEPESSSFRQGGGGPLRNITNTAAATCSGSYTGGGNVATCYVCVPQ